MSTSATGRLPGVARRVNRPKPLVFPFPQFRKHLIGAALRKSMLRRELQSSCGVRFNGCAWLYNETTFPIGHFLPDNGLTWLKIHLATKLGRDGYLAAFGNPCLQDIVARWPSRATIAIIDPFRTAVCRVPPNMPRLPARSCRPQTCPKPMLVLERIEIG